jgi:hypothetical protein
MLEPGARELRPSAPAISLTPKRRLYRVRMPWHSGLSARNDTGFIERSRAPAGNRIGLVLACADHDCGAAGRDGIRAARSGISAAGGAPAGAPPGQDPPVSFGSEMMSMAIESPLNNGVRRT